MAWQQRDVAAPTCKLRVSRAVGLHISGLVLLMLASCTGAAHIKSVEQLVELTNMIYQESRSSAQEAIKGAGKLSNENLHFEHYHMAMLWDFYGPWFNCLSKQHVGKFGDGGKWICGLRTFLEEQQHCTVYSFGSHNQFRFETFVSKKTNCEVYAYDPTNSEEASQQMRNDGITFEPIAIGARNEHGPLAKFKEVEFRTLGKFMEENKHTWIDVLKVDIEGYEWAVFPQWFESWPEKLPFTQLLVELHTSKKYGPKPSTVKWFFEQMDMYGFRVFSIEPNLFVYDSMRGEHLIEYSFIQVDQEGKIVVGPSSQDRAEPI